MPSLAIEVSAPEPLRALLERHLDIARYATGKDLRPNEVERAVAAAAGDARELLGTQGYFSPRVDVRLDDAAVGQVVRIGVEPGPRTTIGEVRIDVEGSIAAGPHADPGRVAEMRRRWELPAGAPFRQEAWADAKAKLLRELLVDRFPYARLVDSTAEIDPGTASANLALTVDSGPLVRLGTVEVRGLSRYDEANVRNLKPFAEGEPYRQDLVLDYQARLQTSGYFESAVVGIGGPPAAGEDLIAVTAPVVVEVVEEPYHKIRLGVGFSTNTGFRFSVEHELNHLLGSDYRLLSAMKLEALAQSLQTQLVSPYDASGYSYRTLARAAASDIQNLKTRDISASFGRVRDREGVETALFGQVLYEEAEVSETGWNRTGAATLNYSWTRRQVDSLLLPTRGYMLNLQGGGGAPLTGSSVGFGRGYAKVAMFVPVGEHSMILRGEVGGVFASTRDGVPQDFLFRAGGDQSVRGYSYQQLGVRVGDAVVGGRYLATASAEYVHRLLADWGVAVFVDAGNAADSLADLEPVFGYGLGARWRSPVGAIGVDVAYGEAYGQVRVHFSLGFTF